MSLSINYNAISLQRVRFPAQPAAVTTIDLLRLDQVHPLVSGNKWFKLRYYLEEAHRQQAREIITYGGAWSNHILATAAACREEGFNCTGRIRGEAAPVLSSTLLRSMELGMQLQFLSRTRYREEKQDPPAPLAGQFIIPEGGYGTTGVNGAATMLHGIDLQSYTHICCAVGTGTMLAGLLKAAPHPIFIGVPVLRAADSLKNELFDLHEKAGGTAGIEQLEIWNAYHFGGYAKHTSGLFQFMNLFYTQTGVPSDFVYTGKLFYAINDQLSQRSWPAGSRLLVIHSGGLQGNDSLEKGTLIF